ncbi:Bifunctional protein GlmU [uncultured archaeon]|nr:Bifunctional protein GlmU [uncultured archaeon]
MKKAKLISLLIPIDLSIKQAMQKLNDTAEKILFIVNESEVLLGTVTDGDIRRGLINGLKFSDKVENVMCKRFSYIFYNEPDKKEKAQTIMLEKKIEQIPILDRDRRIIYVILWADIFGKKEKLKQKQHFSNPVVIMAGGKGTRLDPFTKILPKPLIPIGEKPIIEIIMEKFNNYGFQNFIFTLNYKKEYIKMFLRENNFPYNIDWVEEDNYMGTAGSLSLLGDKLNDTFFVSNCDIILNADYADIMDWHKENNNLMTLIGCHKEVKIPYGILEMDNGILKNFIEKPNYDVLINTGIYVMEPEVISLVQRDRPIDMNILIELASKKGKVSVYPINEGWFDVGQWDEYNKSLKELSNV